MKNATLATKQFKDKYLTDLLNRIDISGYDYPSELSDSDKVKALAEIFYSEKIKHHPQWVRYYGSLQNVIIDWLQGLPSSIDLPVYYSDIIRYAKEMGSLSECATEKQEDKICDNYYRFMSAKLLKLFKAYKVDIYSIVNQ